MLGLGETEQEVEETLDDLRAVGVDIVTLGQYLRPTANHLPIERFITPAEFDGFRERALARGFPRMRVWATGAVELPSGAGAQPE